LRTLIVSDLHLGSATRTDLLRRPELRAPLIEELGSAERVVLLGDVLELRHGPRREALAAARPFFEDLGRVLAGREVVIVAGNHDHALIEPWLERRSELPTPAPLSAEQRIAAHDASPMLAQLAEWAAPARVSAAYPGLWVRSDVYATHGHYLDCHLTIPTLECLGIGAMSRILRRPASSFAGPEDYEAVMLPVFAWIDAVARQTPTGDALNGGMTVRAWRTLGGGRERPGRAPTDTSQNGTGPVGGTRPVGGTGPVRHRLRTGSGRLDARRLGLSEIGRALRTRALSGAFPLAVATLNRAGFGPFGTDISSGELRRAGLRAMGEVAARLDFDTAHPTNAEFDTAQPTHGDFDTAHATNAGPDTAHPTHAGFSSAHPTHAGSSTAQPAHVVFGHTHRAGPLPDDRAVEWRTAGGARLVNTGCWTYDAYFLTPTPGESPYWPGGCVIVEEDGPPVLRRLLEAHAHAELRPSPG
jgi:hypothetical protein